MFDDFPPPRPSGAGRGGVSIGTACVIGGSIGGLLAARVLAGFAERVIVLERDAPAEGSDSRPSVPQGRHGHFLQPEGLELMESWFPGLVREAVGLGAVLAPPGHYELFTDGRPVDFPDVTLLMASRPLLENRIRRRVSAMPNVKIRRARATGLRYRGDAVRGVAYVPVGAEGQEAERVLAADVTVDAMGRSTKITNWLADDHFVVERVPVGIGYTTALFSRPRSGAGPAIACALNQFTTAAPGLPAALAVYAIEQSRWQVVAMAYGRDRAQPTVGDLRSVAASSPAVFREATAGDPIGEAATFYYRESVRRSVVDFDRFPEGLLRIGDAVASFNPIHGSGMASAASQAAVLAEQLASTEGPAIDSRRCARLMEAVADELFKTETHG